MTAVFQPSVLADESSQGDKSFYYMPREACPTDDRAWQDLFNRYITSQNIRNEIQFLFGDGLAATSFIEKCVKEHPPSARVNACMANYRNFLAFNRRRTSSDLLSNAADYVRSQNPSMGVLPSFFPNGRLFPGWSIQLAKCTGASSDTPNASLPKGCESVKNAITFDYVHNQFAANYFKVTIAVFPDKDFDQYMVVPKRGDSEGLEADILVVQKKGTSKPMAT